MKDERNKDDKIYSTRVLTDEVNKERQEKGEEKIIEVNACNGAAFGNYARRDKTYSNAADFFVKLFQKKEEDEHQNGGNR